MFLLFQGGIFRFHVCFQVQFSNKPFQKTICCHSALRKLKVTPLSSRIRNFSGSTGGFPDVFNGSMLDVICIFLGGKFGGSPFFFEIDFESPGF